MLKGAKIKGVQRSADVSRKTSEFKDIPIMKITFAQLCDDDQGQINEAAATLNLTVSYGAEPDEAEVGLFDEKLLPPPEQPGSKSARGATAKTPPSKRDFFN